jgi:hypothetical protein
VLVQKIIPVTIPVLKALTFCSTVETMFTRCNIHAAKGKK